MNFLFKVAANQGLNANRLVTLVGASVSLMALVILLLQHTQAWTLFTRTVCFYALLNGTFFGLGSLAKYAALKRVPTAVVFPLNRLNAVLVMLVGVVVFHERPRPLQYVGIVAGLGVLVLIALERRPRHQRRLYSAGILLALLSAIFTTVSMTVGKLLAETGQDRLAYICVSYALVFGWTLGISHMDRHTRGIFTRRPSSQEWLFGIGIGILNLAGYFMVLQAFGSGPISLSQAIFSSSIIIPILLAALIYRERLTPLRIAAVALAMLAVILISWQ
jgi:drug/metabolite transporter (DMT)-like permease